MAYLSIAKVPPKVQGRRRNRNEVKPLSGLNVEALLGGIKKKVKVSAENTIPGFRQLLDGTESVDGIRDAANQLGNVIENRIKDSFGDIAYGRAIEEMNTMREEMIELEEPDIYNNFVQDLKRKLVAEELSGNRREFWWEMRKAKLGLISKTTSEASNVTEEEVRAVSSIHAFGNPTRKNEALLTFMLVLVYKVMSRIERIQKSYPQDTCMHSSSKHPRKQRRFLLNMN